MLRSDFNIFDHFDQFIIGSFWVKGNKNILDIFLKGGGGMWIDKFRMNILIKSHDTHEIFFELFKLSSISTDDVSLLLYDLSQLVDFSWVKIHSVLKIWTLLTILTAFWLLLVLLLDFSY